MLPERNRDGFGAVGGAELLENGDDVKVHAVLAAESASERVIGAYVSGSVVSVADRKPTVVVNATGGGELVLDLAEAPSSVTVRNTFGKVVARPELGSRLVRLSVPVSGYVEIGY